MTSQKEIINQQLDSLLSFDNKINESDLLSTNVNLAKEIDFSFIFFSDANQQPENKYQLVFELAEFADNHGFKAVWMPERHFHPFGGIYPNPSLLAAALAVKTKHIRLRSGSVVLPLHHPAHVVESWAMVDNLSNGRVDLGFASGWNPNDFIANPEDFEQRRKLWYERIPMVEKLWRGEALAFMNGQGEEIAVQVYPKPIQADLNVWLVVTKSDESFEYAGKHGYNILTMLQGIDLEELGKKIQIYRQARAKHGFNPESGKVTLMLHTLVHENLELVEEAVREPFTNYIKSALSGHIAGMKEKPTEQEINKIVSYSYQRYFTTGALFGSIEDAKHVVRKACQVGVNEIACLMDFGIDYKLVKESLPYLNILKAEITQELLNQSLSKSETSSTEANNDAIAIIGLHGFLPQSMDVETFWHHVDNDLSAITEIPQSRFNWSTYFDETGIDHDKMRSKWGGFIPEIKDFDPAFFGLLPQDAELIDPQQRLLLLSAYKTIEDAGYSLNDLKGSRTGVFIAIEDNEYLTYLRKAGIDLGINGFNHHPSMAANRISYCFDLRGPSEIVNTMCSSAAVAIHNAIHAIKRGEIDQAIVGGARILLDPEAYIGLSRLKVLSTKNTVKSFGEDADGYLRSEGVASILIKPLTTAKRDKNHIYALIKSSAVNYNGKGGMSMAAPNRESHTEVIKSCYTKAGVDIRDIAYIETQGMGNQVSDIIEWEACNSALEQLAVEQNLVYEPGYCAMSTLKPLLGHMECVSALGALFKIIRSFQTNTLHKIAHLDRVNPYLNTANRPCYLLTETKPWPAGTNPRLAALHSYGSGGNNAHLLIEEFPAEQNSLSQSRLTPHEFKLKSCWIETKEQLLIPSMSAKPVKRICIIGAGPAGLVMAKSLLEEGHQPVIFEKQVMLGGLWVLNKDKTAGAYKKTRFQSSKFTSVFSDFYPDDIKSNFYSVDEVKHYLDSYASHFDLNAYIRYQSEVIAVEEKEEQWLVTIQQANQVSTQVFDGVALCQGSFWQPNLPDFKGLSTFKGQTLHSGQYYDNTIFKNKRVLIVGNGVSAMDIAEEAATVASKVVWSRRSVKLILPRMVGFVPNDCQSAARLMIESNRINIIDRLKISMPDYYQAYVKSGLLPTQEEFNKNPIVHINDNIIQLVADGKIVSRKQITYFNKQGCVFEDTHELEEIDIVVFCTGYKNMDHDDARFDFIKHLSIARDFSMGIFYHKNTSLVNTSVLPIAYTGSFYFLEMVARWYAQLLSGRFLLTKEEKNYRITPEHYLIMAPVSAALFGMRLGLFPKPEEEFKEFWRLINYPAFPMIHRLRGVHTNEKAAELLKQFMQKSYVKTEDNDPDLKELKYRILAGLGQENLEKLKAKGEITQIEWAEAQQRVANPYLLTWETQYIKKYPAAQSVESNQIQSLFALALKKILAAILRIDEDVVDEIQDLSTYGFDSISLTTFAREINLKFPFIVLQPTIFLEYTSLQNLMIFLYQEYELDIKKQFGNFLLEENTSVKAVRLYPELMILQKSRRQDIPTFWFHAALGTVQMYLPLVNNLDKDIPVYAIQAKGIATDEMPYDDLIKMANYYTDILLSINQGNVFHLGGYSQGGVIAYEVARQLQLRGERVANLIMIDAPFPPVISFLSEQHHYLLTLINLLQMQQLASLNDIHDYLQEECVNDYHLDFLAELGQRKGLTFSKEQIKNLLHTYFQVSLANLRSMHGYSATPLPFPEQIHCHYFQRHKAQQFFSSKVSSITEFSLQNAYYQQSNCVKRWQILLPHFKVYQTKAADHFSFFDDPQTLLELTELFKQIYLHDSSKTHKTVFEKEQA